MMSTYNYTPRKVTVYFDNSPFGGAWYPKEHLPKNAVVTEEKEIEHNAYWPDGQEKYLHRIEDDGKFWYLGHPKYITYSLRFQHEKDQERMEMIRKAKAEGYRDH